MRWVSGNPPFIRGKGLWIHPLLSVDVYQATVVPQALELRHGEIVLTRCIGYPCLCFFDSNVEGVQFICVMDLSQRRFVPSQGLNESAVLQMGVYIIGIEFQRKVVLFFRFRPVPIVFETLSQRKVSLRKERIQLQCRGGRLFSVGQGLLRGMTSPNRVSQVDIGIGESRVCLGISRVLIDGRFEICNRCLNVLVSGLAFAPKFGKAAHTPSQYGAAAKIIGESLGVHGSSTEQPSTL